MSKKIEMLGKHFGKLTVIAESTARKSKAICWVCQCDCGNTTKPIKGTSLRNGTTKSCGCLLAEVTRKRSFVHGLRETRLYRIRDNMLQRCANPNRVEFKNYGGRGITVCEEWKNSFQAFYEWAMANGYADNLSIDRIDANGNYCPENCRWATMKEQQNNRRNTILIDDSGKLKSVLQLSKELGLDKSTIYRRYHRDKQSQHTMKERNERN